MSNEAIKNEMPERKEKKPVVDEAQKVVEENNRNTIPDEEHSEMRL